MILIVPLNIILLILETVHHFHTIHLIFLLFIARLFLVLVFFCCGGLLSIRGPLMFGVALSKGAEKYRILQYLKIINIKHKIQKNYQQTTTPK